jgi:hypothetical protein
MTILKDKFYVLQLIAIVLIIFSLSQKESIDKTVDFIIRLYILLIMVITILKQFKKSRNSK